MPSIAAYAPIAPRLDREHFSISDLSAEFEVTPRALRFYEDEGLIAPERRGTQRIYSHRDRARLAAEQAISRLHMNDTMADHFGRQGELTTALQTIMRISY